VLLTACWLCYWLRFEHVYWTTTF